MLTFKHSGNAGDVIYSLPAVRAACSRQNESAQLALHLGQPAILYPGAEHPLGNVRLNEAMARMLKPLLEYQSYIAESTTYDNQPIDLDLDQFRQLPINFACGSIPHWFMNLAGETCNLALPWLEARRRKEFGEYIIINRSSRYRNPNLSYRFLAAYSKIIFVGLETEYAELREVIPKLGYYAVDDFLELADVIYSAKFFVGNQSLAFAIAEGLKTPRVLEPCLFAGNVIPTGDQAYLALTQATFELYVQQLAHINRSQ